MKMFRNTAAVLVLTLFTGLAVFTAVQLGDRLFGTSDASAQTVQTQSTTSSGAAATTIDEQQGSDAYGDDQGSGGDASTGGDSSTGADSSSSGDQTYTCPATGCSASSCHATQ